MAGAARARGLAPGRGQSRWTGEFSASASGENSRSSYNLPVLLPWLGATRLVLAGFAADICVLFTAGDAHMREYALWVPSDGVASESPDRHGWALSIMRNSMGAETRNTQQLRLAEWISAQKKPPAFLQAASACSGCGDRI